MSTRRVGSRSSSGRSSSGRSNRIRSDSSTINNFVVVIEIVVFRLFFLFFVVC